MTDKTKPGTVYLIGAGPGDPGLITVKGKRLLETCDVVIFDNLVPDELVAVLPPHIEKHYVGKKAGKACCSQEEINQLMLLHAERGKNVARLKGSDPLIFGRGGEEAKYLHEHDIPFEIIPGVTSGIAVPAYAGIPCTDRNLASFVLFVTGHKAREKEKGTVPWDWVARAKGGTIVIYMGVNEIGKIVAKLLDGGMEPKTPVAILERGTLPTQKTHIGTLSNLPGMVEKENVRPPALFVIGEVVSLQPWLAWFKDKPLLGRRLMVTRAVEQAQELYESLRRLGAEVQPYPTIGTREIQDLKAWEIFKNIRRNEKWLLFTSETGVTYFMKQFFEKIGDIRKLGEFKIGVIGEGSEKYLARYGLMADFVPAKATALDFGRELREYLDLTRASLVRIRGTLAGDDIERALNDAGAEVIPMTLYETYYPKWPEGFRERLFEYPPDGIIFSSGSTVKGLYENLNEEEIIKLTQNADIFSIGPATSKALQKNGMGVALEANPHNIPALIEQMITYYERKGGPK